MSEKDLIETKEELSSQWGDEFLIQSNIDEFIDDKSENDQTSENKQGDIKTAEAEPAEPAVEIIPDEEKTKESEDKASTQKKKLDEVEQSVSKHNSKKSKVRSILLFVFNIVVVAGILTYQLLSENFIPLGGLPMNFYYLFAVIGLLLLMIFIETFLISYLVKQSTGKWRWGLSYKVAQLGRYYDDITPLAAGGQPFQMTYLKSRGVPIHTSLSIPLAKYVFTQIAWVFVSLACLIISWIDTSYGTFVSITSLIGFILGFLMLAATIFLSVCKTVGKKLVVKVLRLLYKMKIIKNYDKQYEKITKYISDYQDVMKQYASSPKDFAIMTLVSILRLIVLYSMPFFIVKFLVPGLEWNLFIKLFVMGCLVDLAASFFPLPGGAGMNEISFSTAFGSVVGETDALVWILILWRTCTFYFYLVQGVCIISYDMAYGNRKYRWQVRKNYLAEESAIFKQEQINRFRSDRAKRRKIKN